MGCFDLLSESAETLAADFGGVACPSVEELFGLRPDVIVVAVTHDQLADLGCRALESGSHVLVEKPAGIGVTQVDQLLEVQDRVGRLVKVGFNHRFHLGIARAITEARSGLYGDVLYLRGRYGHGGRLGYEREWRADPADRVAARSSIRECICWI